jgi:hypothetical protein
MLKLISAILFVVMCSIVPLYAQSIPDVPAVKETRTATRAASQADLRQVFSKETQKLKSDSLSVDAKKMERLRLKQATRSGWTRKQTIAVVLFAVAVAAIVFFVIKYGKNCLRYENNCDPAFDENCYCEEYEQNEARRR